MKFKIMAIVCVTLLLSGCVGPKQVAALTDKIAENEQRISELETAMADTDRDGVPDYLDAEPNTVAGAMVDNKGRSIDMNLNGIADELEKYIENETHPPLTSAGPDDAELYFTSIAPTAYLELNSFFKIGETFKHCNDRLIKIINTKLKIPAGQYKYFALQGGGYAIVTRIRCINPENGAFKSDCAPANTCGFFAFNCVEEGYSQFLMFIVAKNAGEGSTPVSMYEFEEMINNGKLSTNYNSIPQLEKLISDKNKFDKFYTFNIRMFEIRRAAMSKPKMVEDATYDFESKMIQLFKN